MHKTTKMMIFDLDDTLIHSNINYFQIRYQIAELFASPLSDEIISKTPILGLLEKLKQTNPDKFAEGYRRIEETERKATKTATVIEGADKIPSILKKYDIHSAILTNNSKSTVDLYLAKFDFLKEFRILTREDFNNPKPDPEGIISIIRGFQSKQITKENSLYVGDSYIDAIAAHRADIRFIWFNSRNIDQTLIPTTPYAILTDWADFESVLQGKEE